jgi:hypothetical protein
MAVADGGRAAARGDRLVKLIRSRGEAPEVLSASARAGPSFGTQMARRIVCNMFIATIP